MYQLEGYMPLESFKKNNYPYVMSTEIISGVVAIISGGGVVAIYNAVASARAARLAQEEEPEKYIRQLLTTQVNDLSDTVEEIRARLEDMLATNARLEAERKALIKQNEELLEQNRVLLAKLDKLTKNL